MEFPEVADTLWNLSNEEMRHMQLLHNMVEKVIKQYRETNGDPPANMLAVYDYVHEQAIEKATEAKMIQNMYKD